VRVISFFRFAAHKLAAKFSPVNENGATPFGSAALTLQGSRGEIVKLWVKLCPTNGGGGAQ